MQVSVLLLFTCIYSTSTATLYFNSSIHNSLKSGKYRAAVYEHAVIFQDDPEIVLSRSEALALMKKNLAIYEVQAKLAADKGAQILVFPEDGLYGWDHTRQSKRPYLETIPDPDTLNWNPCDDPGKILDSEVQELLSCMAKSHGLYIVGNMGQVEPCYKSVDPKCPEDGRYQFNTNVVYDPNGNFLTRYRKYYLFHEPGFDVPNQHEVKTFDTPYGRFGTFICADIIYKTPAVDLVDLGIKNIAFPTAWDNIFPYNVAIQAQQAYAAANRVNLLAADVQNVDTDIGGSGIYSSSEAIQFVYNTKTDTGTLLVGDVPITPTIKDHLKVGMQDHAHLSPIPDNTSLPQNSCLASNTLNNNNTIIQDTYFTADMTGDEFSFVALAECEGKVKVCNGSFCCSLEYKFRDKASDELYVLGAWAGLHTYQITLVNQVCAVVKCASLDRSSCGQDTREAASTFDHFILEGAFEADKVYPRLLTFRGGQFDLSTTDWDYSYGKISSSTGFQNPLLSATLYGRYFCDGQSEV